MRLGEAHRAHRREAARVPELLESLERLSPGQRALRIRNAPERYASRALCEELFRKARACLPADPAGSRGWAETAEAVAASYPEPHPPHALRALAFRGNAVRAAGDFRAARRLLRLAREGMLAEGVADLDLHAELHSFLGSLFTDLRHFDEAREHLDAAARLYTLVGDDDGAARVMMKMANLSRYRGDIAEALEADREATALVSPGRSPRLYLAARFNLASNLVAAGDHDVARDVLAYDEDLYEDHSDRHTWIRYRWLQGRVAGEVGDPELAEECLREVRDEFGRQEQGFDAALACLDLAALYHREGRHAALRETAARAVRLFEAHEIHRDALAALLLLRDAAAAERVTAETLRRVAEFVRTAAHEPGARFEPES
jgi:tetratricopeptide (TPR) repeat protein